MIVDASAVLAVLLEEPDGGRISKAMIIAPGPHEMSVVNYIEAAIRVDRLPVQGKSLELDTLIDALDITLAAATREQAAIARSAYRAYGKGRHPAKLNLGDCFAYALAKARSEPLLFKGDDFRQTDIEAAL